MENTNLKIIALDILRSKCIYKYINRSGWICGFGKGMVAYIEDHRNSVVIQTYHFSSYEDLIKDNYFGDSFIDCLITVKSRSSEGVIDYISVALCGESEIEPDYKLINMAKQKLYFGYSIHDTEITNEDVEKAIEKYYSDRKKAQEKFFNLK